MDNTDLLLDHLATLWTGAPFPSAQALSRARRVVEGLGLHENPDDRHNALVRYVTQYLDRDTLHIVQPDQWDTYRQKDRDA